MARKKNPDDVNDTVQPGSLPGQGTLLPAEHLTPDPETLAEIERRRLAAAREKKLQIEHAQHEMIARVAATLRRSNTEDGFFHNHLIAHAADATLEIVTPDGNTFRVSARLVQRRRT